MLCLRGSASSFFGFRLSGMNLLANFQIGMSTLLLLRRGFCGPLYFLEHIPWDDRLSSSSWSLATKLGMFMVPLCLELLAVIDGILNCNTCIFRYLIVLENI